MKVGIRFSDNDFYITLQRFMQHLVDAYNERDDERDNRSDRLPFVERVLTKKRIVKLFNSLSVGFYWLYQNRFRYNQDQENSSHLQEYLQIEIANVYLGDEVDQYIKSSNGWDNGEFQYVDIGGDNEINCI
jgi:hypothetical protein